MAQPTDHQHATHDHGDHDHGHAHHAPEDDHGHAHHGHGHLHAENASEKRLWTALGLLFAFTLVEGGGGLWANSIALLAEAVHMLADCASLLLAVIAIRVGKRPARPDRTYGHRRYQTLAAYTNGLALLALTLGVAVQAVSRLISPPPVNGTVMLAVALLGGAANLAAFLVLCGGSSLNERGARAHVLGDLLGSGAAAAAAGIILGLNWLPADPLLSLLMAALILRSGWQITRGAAHVLLEGAPESFDIAALEKELTGLPGVSGVHHVHAWSLTGEAPIVTLHADLVEGADRGKALAYVLERLRLRFGIQHATVQLEEGECADAAGVEECHDSR